MDIREWCKFQYRKLIFRYRWIMNFWYQKLIFDIKKSNFWYQKFNFWYWIFNFRYRKFIFRYQKFIIELWISTNTFFDIDNSIFRYQVPIGTPYNLALSHRRVHLSFDQMAKSCVVGKYPKFESLHFWLKTDETDQACITPGSVEHDVKSVKCYRGGRKIHFISLISKISTQMGYHCVQYTRRHLMSLISHF